jgi:predicted CopG family antitoxin
MSTKGKNVKEEKSISDSLDEIIEMKKNENSALKKIFDSLNKPKRKENSKT